MAFTSLQALPYQYNLVSSGVSRLYAILYDDLTAIDGLNIYTLSTLNGMVNAIGFANSNKFVQLGLLKNSTKLDQELKRNIANGTKYYQQSITTAIAEMNVANRAWVENAVGRPIVIIIRDLFNNFFLIGQDGFMEITAITGGIGMAEGDMNGYAITFTAVGKRLVYKIDPSIVENLINGGSEPAPQFTAYWGWVSDPTTLTTVDSITSLQGSGQFTSGANVVADFRGNTTPNYLVMAEPLTEPVKLDWYGSELNQGQIGNPDTDLFNAPVTVGTVGVYISVYPTTQTDTTITFLT